MFFVLQCVPVCAICMGMKRGRPQRAFRRDEALSIRLPSEDKDRLRRLAESRRRDTSSLALEFINAGVAMLESQARKQMTGATA